MKDGTARAVEEKPTPAGTSEVKPTSQVRYDEPHHAAERPVDDRLEGYESELKELVENNAIDRREMGYLSRQYDQKLAREIQVETEKEYGQNSQKSTERPKDEAERPLRGEMTDRKQALSSYDGPEDVRGREDGVEHDTDFEPGPERGE